MSSSILIILLHDMRATIIYAVCRPIISLENIMLFLF